jgi:hypothetical protein
MRRSRQAVFSLLVATVVVAADAVWAADDARLERLKKEVTAEIEELADLSQQMNDVVFSFAELGFGRAPPGAAEVLLRPDEVPQLPGAARDHLSDAPEALGGEAQRVSSDPDYPR